MSDPAGVVDELISEAAPVAEKVTVDFFMISVLNAAQRTVALARQSITACPAMDADGRSSLQVPFAGIVTLERLVGEYACRTDLCQIAAEDILQNTIFMTTEIDVVVRGKGLQVTAACIIPIKPDAAVTVYATVHFMVQERPEILVPIRPFFKPGFSVDMSCHNCHVLEVTLSPLVTDRAIMRVVQHQQFDNARAEGFDLGIIGGYAEILCHRGHAGHDDFALGIVFIPELLHSAEPAGADRMQGRVPAEVRDVEPQIKTGMEEIAALFLHLIWSVVNKDRRHSLSCFFF